MITPEQKKEGALRQYFFQYLPPIKRSIYLFRQLTEQKPALLNEQLESGHL